MSKNQTVAVGGKITFTGYTNLEPGQEELLTVGGVYTVQQVNPDGGLVVSGGGVADTIFPEEMEVTVTKAKAAAKPKATKTNTKATTKPKTAVKAKTKVSKSAAVKAAAEHLGMTVTDIKITPVAPQYIAPITDSPSVITILENQDMLAAAKSLAIAAEETFISLGGVLSHIYDTGAHKTLGFDGKRGFADYMLGELNIQYRKGMYLIEIYKVARQLNLDEALLAQIGWSKMKEISGKLDAENAAELLEYARAHTREELVAHVRTSYVKQGDGSEDLGRVLKTRLTFNLFGDQTEVVNRAMTAATAMIDNPTPEQALVLIAAEWSQFTEGVELSAREALEAMVARFGAEAVRDELASIGSVAEDRAIAQAELVTA